MALTVVRSPSHVPQLHAVIVDLDDSYPSGGYDLSAAGLGFTRPPDTVVILPSQGLQFEYFPLTEKLKVFCATLDAEQPFTFMGTGPLTDDEVIQSQGTYSGTFFDTYADEETGDIPHDYAAGHVIPGNAALYLGNELTTEPSLADVGEDGDLLGDGRKLYDPPTPMNLMLFVFNDSDTDAKGLAVGTLSLAVTGTFRGAEQTETLTITVDGSGGAAATATLTSDNTNPSEDETVTIGAVTYTFKAAVTTGENEILIGADADATLLNLKNAINLEGTPGTDYGSDTEIHPTVTAGAIAAHALTLDAKTEGTAGNALASTETSGHLSFADTTFAGGVNPQNVIEKCATGKWTGRFKMGDKPFETVTSAVLTGTVGADDTLKIALCAGDRIGLPLALHNGDPEDIDVLDLGGYRVDPEDTTDTDAGGYVPVDAVAKGHPGTVFDFDNETFYYYYSNDAFFQVIYKISVQTGAALAGSAIPMSEVPVGTDLSAVSGVKILAFGAE